MRSPFFCCLVFLVALPSRATECSVAANFHLMAMLLQRCLVTSSRLLRNLTADFAARVSCRMHVDIKLAGSKVGGLRIGQRR
jgi:hypothetical protein